ncbi:hypothetical protein J5289_16225 [Rhizobium sp. B230/85]|uniref:spike base protein, RCAP_Rcc01079 family n=1 Tax=unclassified Rhizobium TaxID=2613769 RepID=UPI001ADA8BC1|nr:MULTISPECIES: hypothetical protein [unclassified Rhizobium]MBO9131729.1 hypothetical protein [Rhizobium sp. B209b/85]QXZ95703.1 hypothetical protein J5289_16225 [Rhizobium sp. B230/85]
MGYFAELFKNQRAALVPQGVIAVSPSDTADLTKPIRGFMVTSAGNVSVVMSVGSAAVMPGCLVGIQYMGAISRIKATGTTATGIVGFI